MRGGDLARAAPTKWPCRGSVLLLNPRTDANAGFLAADFPDLADHVWLASSGTSGQTKIVALSRAAMESGAVAVNRHLGAGPGDCWLNPLPLFHVGGLGIVVRAALSGSRCEFLAGWNATDFACRASQCGATLSSLVPAQVYDIVSAGLRCPSSVRAVVVGGGRLEETVRLRAAELGWPLLPSYGMTETSSQVATSDPGARDFCWLPLLGHIEARVGDNDMLEVRGASLLTGWMLAGSDGVVRWEDPKIGGWFRTRDRVELREGKLRFLGRVDDVVKIRGELADLGALERELQGLVPSGLVRLDAEPDERNGFNLVVVAENTAAEAEAREAVDVFPPFARPVRFAVGKIELNPLGKKVRIKR